jgi:hypothetical protein
MLLGCPIYVRFVQAKLPPQVLHAIDPRFAARPAARSGIRSATFRGKPPRAVRRNVARRSAGAAGPLGLTYDRFNAASRRVSSIGTRSRAGGAACMAAAGFDHSTDQIGNVVYRQTADALMAARGRAEWPRGATVKWARTPARCLVRARITYPALPAWIQ